MDLQLNCTTCIAAAGYIAANPAVRETLKWAARTAFTVEWRRQAVPADVLVAVVATLAGTPAAAQGGPIGRGQEPILPSAGAVRLR